MSFAMKNYDNIHCRTIEEFGVDFKKFGYIEKLLKRYRNDPTDLKERVILNHIVVLFNVFGDATPEMLYFKLKKEYWSAIHTFLVFLNRDHSYLETFGINTADIPLDHNIVNTLRAL